MLVSKQIVISDLKRYNTPYWRVYNGRNIVSEQFDTIPIIDAQELLEKFLESCYGDYAVVKLYTKKQSDNSDKEVGTTYHYEVELKGEKKQSINNHIGYPDYKLLEKERDEKFELKLQIMKLELESKTAFDWNKIIPVVQPLLLGIANALNKKPIGASQDQELNTALAKLKQANPDGYEQIKQQIIDYSNGKVETENEQA